MKHFVFCLNVGAILAISFGAPFATPFTPSSTAQAEEFKTLILGQSIESREARASEYDKASSTSSHSEVSFQIEDHAETRVGQIQLNGFLINSSSSKVSVYIAGKNSALRLQIAESNDVKLRTDLPKLPPSPSPAMFVLDIPARTRVQLTGTTELGRLTYRGTPTVTLKWAFQFWTPPKPSGTLQFQMPALAQTKLDKLKIEIQKFTAAEPREDRDEGGAAAIVTASLRNISQEPQIFCRGIQTSFYWDLRDSKGESLKNRKDLGAESRDKLKVDMTSVPLLEAMCSIIAPGQAIDLDSTKIFAADGTFEFHSHLLSIGGLRPGTYQIHLRALNLAANATGADLALVNRLIQAHHAAKPTEVIETGLPLSIP